MTDSFHETSGLVYVLEGRLQLDAGGMQEVLEAGDCAYIESEMALAWSAAGKHRCRVLAVLPGVQGARKARVRTSLAALFGGARDQLERVEKARRVGVWLPQR